MTSIVLVFPFKMVSIIPWMLLLPTTWEWKRPADFPQRIFPSHSAHSARTASEDHALALFHYTPSKWSSWKSNQGHERGKNISRSWGWPTFESHHSSAPLLLSCRAQLPQLPGRTIQAHPSGPSAFSVLPTTAHPALGSEHIGYSVSSGRQT